MSTDDQYGTVQPRQYNQDVLSNQRLFIPMSTSTQQNAYFWCHWHALSGVTD